MTLLTGTYYALEFAHSSEMGYLSKDRRSDEPSSSDRRNDRRSLCSNPYCMHEKPENKRKIGNRSVSGRSRCGLPFFMNASLTYIKSAV